MPDFLTTKRNFFEGSMSELVKPLIVLCLVLIPFSLNALTVAPARIEVSAAPGETIRGEMLLVNEQETEKTFYASYANFEAQGETGTPNFVEAEEGLATWINTQESVTLEPGEQQEIAYSIQVPNGAEPGGHFAGIFWGTQPVSGEGETQVSVGAKIGALVLLSVAGDVEEGGGIIEFATENNKRWFTSLPVGLTYRFRNSGGDRVKPEGEIVIRNTFGLETERLTANKSAGNILPTSVRRFDVTWGEEASGATQANTSDQEPGFFSAVQHQFKHFAFGRYTANLSLTYGEQGDTDTVTTAFYVIPWQLLSVVIIILMLIFMIFRVGLRRYRRTILDQARREWETRERAEL